MSEDSTPSSGPSADDEANTTSATNWESEELNPDAENTGAENGESSGVSFFKRTWQILSVISTLHGLYGIAKSISIATLGGVLAAFFHVFLGGTIGFFTSLLTTIPLTAAIAIIIFGIYRGWISHPAAFVLTCAIALFATGYIARVLEVPGAIDIQDQFNRLIGRNGKSPGLIVTCLQILEAYVRIYGFVGFVISFCTGWFVAHVWNATARPQQPRVS